MRAAPCVFRYLIERPVLAAVADAPLPFWLAASLQACTRWAQSACAGAANNSSDATAIASDVRSVAMGLIFGRRPQRGGHQPEVLAGVLFVGNLPRIDAGSEAERQAGLELGGVRDRVGLQTGQADRRAVRRRGELTEIDRRHARRRVEIEQSFERVRRLDTLAHHVRASCGRCK